MWWKTSDDNYVNSRHVGELVVGDVSGGLWAVFAYTSATTNTGSGMTSIRLAGDYDTQAEAQDAARRLVHGFDPSI